MTGLSAAVAVALVLGGLALGAAIGAYQRKQLEDDLDLALGERDAARERLQAMTLSRDHYRGQARRWYRSRNAWKRQVLSMKEAGRD